MIINNKGATNLTDMIIIEKQQRGIKKISGRKGFGRKELGQIIEYKLNDYQGRRFLSIEVRYSKSFCVAKVPIFLASLGSVIPVIIILLCLPSFLIIFLSNS